MSKESNKELNPELAKIIHFLQKDETKNCSHIGFIYNYGITSFKIINNSFIIKGTSDRDWVYLSCANNEELNLLLNETDPEDKCFAVIEDWMMPFFLKQFKLRWKLSVLKFVLPNNVEIKSLDTIVTPLMTSDAEYIYLNSKYKEYLSVEYIKERINNGISAGIYLGNKLAAWAITQDDNAIGFLHVLDEYRGKGLAKQIIEYMASKVRETDLIPFAYIEETNLTAIKLVQKIGFQKNNKVHWFEVE